MLDQLADAFAAAFAVLFLSASLAKARRPESWIGLARRVVPKPRLAAALVVGLPVAEALTGVSTLVAPQAGLLASAALLTLLSLGALIAMQRARDISCACFGSLGRSTIGPRLVIRNALLAALAVATSESARTRSSRIEMLEAALLASTALAIARVRRPARRLPLAVDDQGNRVVVVLGADCPACHELASRIGDVQTAARADALSVVIVGGLPAARLALEHAVGNVARVEDESVARSIAAVSLPWAVKTDGTGRIVDERPAGSWLVAVPDTSRRSFLLGAATFAGFAWVGRVAPALAASLKNPSPGSPYSPRPLPKNDYRDTCKGFVTYLGTTGVSFPLYPYSKPGAEGYTNAFPLEWRLIDVKAAPGRTKIVNAKRAFCECPGKRPRYYDDEGKCEADCPHGLKCYTYQCRRSGTVCVEQEVAVSIPSPDVGFWVTRWTPTEKSRACRALAAAEYNSTIAHERHHVDDTFEILKNARQQYHRSIIVGCGPDEQSAKAELKYRMDELIKTIKQDIWDQQDTGRKSRDDELNLITDADAWCKPCSG